MKANGIIRAQLYSHTTVTYESGENRLMYKF